MNRLLGGAVKAAGALAVAGGAVLASALPAGAVTLPRSWGAQATGIVSLAQVALSTPGTTPVTAFNVSADDLFGASFILDRSGPDTAYSKVANPVVAVSSALAAIGAGTAISMCTTGVGGSTTLVGGSIAATGQPVIHLPVTPGVNTQIKIPGGVTITLNKQNYYGGIRQVTAIYVAYSGQNVSIGVTRC